MDPRSLLQHYIITRKVLDSIRTCNAWDPNIYVCFIVKPVGVDRYMAPSIQAYNHSLISTETIRDGPTDVMDLVLAAHDRTDTITARGMEITRSHAYLPCPPRGSNQTMS